MKGESMRKVWVRRVAGLLSLGILAGLGSVGTLAYWTDTATMTVGSITAGQLDIQLDGNLPGQGGSWENPKATLADMIPGESFAFTVPVQRPADSVAFTYKAEATASGTLASALRWSVHPGGTAGTPTTSNGVRSNTCTGTATASSVTLSDKAISVIPSRTTLASGTGAASENVCIRVSLPSDAPNSAQGTTAAATFTFSATQVQ